MTGYALDRARGTVARIDPATFEVGPAVEVIPDSAGELYALPAGDELYVVDQGRGRVAVADPTSLDSLRGAVRSLAEPVVASVVDGRGRLWTLGKRTGDLTWFDGTVRHSRRHAAPSSSGATLAVVDGRAAIVERASRIVHLLDDDGGAGASSCLDLDPADDSVQVNGSTRDHRLYVVSGDDGMLRVSDLGSGDCGDVAIPIADAGSELGVPQEAQGRLFVPDYTSGTVIIVDLESGQVTRTGVLVDPGVSFELLAEDGIVFYNDPGSERAGVVAIDGTFTAVQKYDPDHPGEGVDSGGDPQAGDEQAGADGSGTGAGAAGDEPVLPEGPRPGGDKPPAPAAPGADTPAPEEEPPAPDPAAAPPPGSPADTTPPSQTPPPGQTPTSTPPPGQTPPVSTPTQPPPGTPTQPPSQPPAGDPLIVTAPTGTVQVDEDLTLGVRPRDPDATLSNIRWNFADGSTATGGSPTHAWSTPGRYRVTVSATLDPGGPGGGFADIVVLAAPPPQPPPLAARFTMTNPVAAGSPVHFTDQSSGGPTSWQWTFEDGRGPTSSNLQAPPDRFWDFTGTFTVTLQVRRGSQTDTTTQTLTVVDPPPQLPDVTDIMGDGSPGYDDQTTYKFWAIIINGGANTCTFTIEGQTSTCATGPSHAGTEISTTHRFASGGQKTIALHLDSDAGPVDRTLTIDVVAIAPPVPIITVSGAPRTGVDEYTKSAGAPLTLDGSASSGTFDHLEWSDDLSGATFVGSVWSPDFGVGTHHVTLVAKGPPLADVSTAVTIIVLAPDTTPPTGSVQADMTAGTSLSYTAIAADPESGVLRVDLYGTFSYLCVRDGDPTDPGTEASVDFSATPFASAQGPELTSTGPGSVSFVGSVALCPAGQSWFAPFTLDAWAVVLNGAGLATITDHETLFGS
jgi:PKD repeat protein